MGYKEFEKHLNTSLNNRNAKDIEHEAMWEAIESELPKRKKRRFAFWWLTGIVSILLFGYFIQANITSIESQTENSQDSTGQNITNHAGKINESILNVDVAQNSDETVDIVNESIINSTRSVLRNTTKTNTEKQLENVFKKPHSVESKIGPSSHIVLEEYAVEDNKNEVNLAETQQNNKDFQNSSVKENIFQKDLRKEEFLRDETIDSNEKELELPLPIVEDSNSDIDTVTKEIAVEDLILENNENKLNKPSKWSLGVAVGYYFPTARYGENGNQALLALRKEIEEPLEAIDLGLTLDYKFTKNWSISSGILYSRINQKALNVQRTIEEIPGDVIVGQVSSVSGDYYIEEEGLIPHEVTKLFQRHVSYSSIAIPIQIRYTRTLSKRLGWTASTGFEYSLKSSQSSYEQDLDGIEYDLATDLLKRTNKNSSHYALLGLRLNYHFSKKIHFNIGGQSKYAISDLYNDAAFQKRYFLPGVTSGLIINF